MTDMTARPGDLHLVAQAAFGSQHAFRTARPLAEALVPGFWGKLRHNLWPGDTVRLVRMSAVGGVAEFLDTIVVESGPEGVVLHPAGPAQSLTPQTDPEPDPTPTPTRSRKAA